MVRVDWNRSPRADSLHSRCHRSAAGEGPEAIAGDHGARVSRPAPAAAVDGRAAPPGARPASRRAGDAWLVDLARGGAGLAAGDGRAWLRRPARSRRRRDDWLLHL